MTWTGIDSTAYAADEAAHSAIPVRVRSNLLDDTTVRTQAGSRGWSADTGYLPEFSTPSNSFRSIPIGTLPTAFACDTIAVRLRYRLDDGGTSGITAPTTAGEVRLSVNGVLGDVVEVEPTGATTTDVTVTCSPISGDIGGAVELHLKSRRGSSAGTFTVYDIRSPNVLAHDASFTPTGDHIELDATSGGARNQNPSTLHVCTTESANAGSADNPTEYDYLSRVWPDLVDRTNGFPVGDGKTLVLDAYNLPAWKLYGLTVEYRSSEDDLAALPPLRAIQSGVPITTAPVRQMTAATRALLTRRPRIHHLGVTLGASGAQYRTGLVVDSTSETTVGGGIVTQVGWSRGLFVTVGMLALDYARDIPATLKLYIDQVSGGSASDSFTTQVFPSGLALGRPRADGELGTLHAWNVQDVPASSWNPQDTGLVGDIDFLTTSILRLDFPDTAGTYRWRVTTTGVKVWIGYVTCSDQMPGA